MEIAAANGALTGGHTKKTRQCLKDCRFARSVAADKSGDAALKIDPRRSRTKAAEILDRDAF
jgi:hypothetical protein